jgi:signal transduction histidine kinase
MVALGQVTAGIAHEINNPLNFISGGVDALANTIQEIATLLRRDSGQRNDQLIDELENDLQNLIHTIKNGVLRSNKIISSLRNFSSPQESSWSGIRLHDAIDSALTILNSKIRHNNINVISDYDETVTVFGNASQLTQVFINLIDNAAQALQNIDVPRKIRIGATSTNQMVQITIADNGNGIPEEDRDRVFDPFFTTKPVGQGTGLGLAISYAIIERHKGTISFTSNNSIGTEFKISLPT